ncbi:MSMEG_1061 family FMN-dependent PPOX-type flavoprotein [Nakamurella sp. A5-74]|uniref:MSMEG_1061 family FMN-dependent PPOX-type flavoprotein n=1 Tax=Nakamurella sp. A5-74 TaxID=3158264 RepID=A0AAU8DN65_9ACTN
MDEPHPDTQRLVQAAVPDPHAVRSEEQLLALYPTPVARSWAKESSVVTPGYRELIAASPFCVIATNGPDGIDCSPRGDAPGFVGVLDERTLMIPDRRGNNRLDTLRNITRDSRIGLVFVIPGIGEAVRVRGVATISTDPNLLRDNAVRGIEPVTVLVVRVDRIYFQCRRATLRSALWQAPHVDPASLPTPGRLQAEVGAMSEPDARDYDRSVAAYAAATLYEGPSKP